MARVRISLAMLSFLSVPISQPVSVPIPCRAVEFNFAEIKPGRRKKLRFVTVRCLPNYCYFMRAPTVRRRHTIRSSLL